ncbi:hypothetical protein CH380_15225 [Leptospira adleri]|uniref:DUF4386 family protein n=2 Tax=Leptospira adleri TaxID=2023186 RepID=A0A2M9YLW5_9LEPT|nr:hypothetical protein CH380_15225 [Leptospira adleri]PJZ63683.1 hypothetical protein CH376_02240 [Leptospira adleri]
MTLRASNSARNRLYNPNSVLSFEALPTLVTKNSGAAGIFVMRHCQEPMSKGKHYLYRDYSFLLSYEQKNLKKRLLFTMKRRSLRVKNPMSNDYFLEILRQRSQPQEKRFLFFGGIFTVISALLIVCDVLIGILNGVNVSKIPQTAIGRFEQFRTNPLLSLYNLDLLTVIIQIFLIPSYFALYIAQKEKIYSYSLFAFLIFFFGSILLVSNNVSLAMYELSIKYFSTNVVSEKLLYLAAGEALLSQGKHGSPAVFLGFFLPSIANLSMSIVMLKSDIFGKVNSWFGIIGALLLTIYVVFINFHFGFTETAAQFAVPGGLLSLLWMILYAIRLIKLSKDDNFVFEKYQGQ